MKASMAVRDLESSHLGTAGKEERYGWIKRNKPGELTWVSKRCLLVDDTYQRTLNDTKRKQIASAFNWAAFGVLIVARRRDGSLFVIDGQHRLAAALSRSDITDVPCVIFDTEDDVAGEARDFIDTNTSRKPVNSVEKFKALLVTEDHAALVCQRLATEAGREVRRGASATTLTCVTAVMKLIVRNEDAFCRAWPVIVAICEGEVIHADIVEGVAFLENRLMSSNGTKCGVKRIKDRLLSVGYIGLLNAMSEAKAYHRNSGEKVCALGLLNAANHRLSHRYRIDPLPAEGMPEQ